MNTATPGPWLDTLHAAAHVGYTDALGADPVRARRARRAFRMWAIRRGVVPGRRGSRLVYTKADLDHALTGRRASAFSQAS